MHFGSTSTVLASTIKKHHKIIFNIEINFRLVSLTLARSNVCHLLERKTYKGPVIKYLLGGVEDIFGGGYEKTPEPLRGG
jgi:hypothetical protein